MAALKLDEKLPDSVGTIPREAGHDVALARDEQLIGVPDERLLAAATAEGRALVSFDRGLANVIQHPPAATAGIAVIRLREQTLPHVRLAAASLADSVALDGAAQQGAAPGRRHNRWLD